MMDLDIYKSLPHDKVRLELTMTEKLRFATMDKKEAKITNRPELYTIIETNVML